MKTYILSLVLILLLAFTYTGCSSSSDGSTPTSNNATGITGVVTDMEGEILSGVLIYSGNTTTTTNDVGAYTLDIAAAQDISLTAELSNYARNSKLLNVVDKTLTQQDIKLAKVDTIQSFSVANGASISAKGATVDLPVAAYTLDDGSTYNGEVTVKATYNRVTTVNGSEAFPGEFLGETTGGDTKVLLSYGFIDVTLESESGANIKLADNASATLTYPMDPNIEDTPATIPLWYFDTDKGIWIEDGLATFDATTNTYVGSVTHFSTWNLDAAFDGATLVGCIEDANGNPLPLANLFLSSPGWNNSSDHQITNNDVTGEFSLLNAPSNVLISIQAELNGLVSEEQNLTLLPNQTTTMNDCLVVNVDSTELFMALKIRILDNANNPLSNVSVQFLNPDDSSSIGYQNTDANGSVSVSFQKDDVTNVKVSLSSNGLNFEKTYSIDSSKAVQDLGDYVLATTTYNGCVTLESGSSTSAEGNTTLSDGITEVDDGTVVSDDGFTAFGSDSRTLSTQTAYGSLDYFNQSGSFSILVQRDNLEHNLFAHTYVLSDPNDNNSEKVFNLTGKTTFNALASIVNRTDVSQCIELHKISDTSSTAKAYLTTSNSDVHLEVQFTQSSSNWGSDIVAADSELTSATFDLNKNGAYVIKQAVNGYNTNTILNGKMSVEVNGKKYEITIPDPDTIVSFQGEPLQWWTAFRVEVYDGEITVTEVNELW